MKAPAFTIDAIEFGERPVTFRMPFRFGAATLDAAPQAFVRARIRMADGKETWGHSAEMMMPKWFDKDPLLTYGQNIDQLRCCLMLARDAYVGDRTSSTAFGHHARNYSQTISSAARNRLPLLAAGFGPALIDRAVIDAFCRALSKSFFDVMQCNAVGFDPVLLLPEFAGFSAPTFLSRLTPLPDVALRHTIGLADPIDASDPAPTTSDTLPWHLVDVIAKYRPRYFKIKLCGELPRDIDRLRRIDAVIEHAAPDCLLTLDGNEQFADHGALADFWIALRSDSSAEKFVRRILWIEQPLPRAIALSQPVADVEVPLMIDESDDALDAFPRARALGYRGVSSKSCKGLYKSLVNVARAARWNAEKSTDLGAVKPFFVSAEDLTMQAGIAVQQDLALVSLIGITHVERNGHHYVNGMAGAPVAEQRAYLAAHPDLYESDGDVVRLSIRDGMLSTRSLHGSGFSSLVEPDWRHMHEMVEPRCPPSD